MLEGTVLITGGSGFLGRAILRRAQRENWPAKFIVYSRDEMKQWELMQRYPETRCVLGDVAREFDRLTYVMQGVDTVIHAAAVKFIPEAETNVFETVAVNIDGSRNVAQAAARAGVKTVIGISTDKACAPFNLYGMTKAVMERMFSEANHFGKTNFVNVRYGNVIGSTGSVIPVFQKQIREKNQLRVTDSRMTRFWLSFDEAIDLILWAHSLSDKYSGHTFISSCPAMKIVDIAKTVWQMERPESEPDIIYPGIRPGEKLHEWLFNEHEAPRVTILKGEGFVMAPATEVGQKLPDMMAYTSDHPKYWITLEQMQQHILDAATI